MYRYFISLYATSPVPPAQWNMANATFEYSKEIDSAEDISKVTKHFEDRLEGKLKGFKITILSFQLLKVTDKQE